MTAVRTTLRPAPADIEPDAPPPSARRSVELFRTHPFLRDSTAYSTVMNFVASTLLSVLILGQGTDTAAAVTVGGGLSLAAAAGIAGSLAAPAIGRWTGLRGTVTGIAAARAAVLLAVAASGNAAAVVVAVASATLLSPVLGVTLTAARLTRIPSGSYGSTSGMMSFVTMALQPLAPLAGGALLAAWSTSGAVLILGLLCAALAVFAWQAPGFAAT